MDPPGGETIRPHRRELPAAPNWPALARAVDASAQWLAMAVETAA